ncbi:MAG: hypothetical protein AseanaTS_27850 [Candidatus Pelagadaptatus aseana]|uniref:DUF6122 family protein n=1 Tax=Candidatus Pelagadaptatus aseana TaxID=3120508 RepID=UPI0039B30FBB
MIHIALHFLLPLLVALVFFRSRWRLAFVIMAATMLVDLDHLLANPIYDPQRCSLGFHPLHRLGPVIVYLLLCLPAQTRLYGLGLSIHMILDGFDCQPRDDWWSGFKALLSV